MFTIVALQILTLNVTVLNGDTPVSDYSVSIAFENNTIGAGQTNKFGFYTFRTPESRLTRYNTTFNISGADEQMRYSAFNVLYNTTSSNKTLYINKTLQVNQIYSVQALTKNEQNDIVNASMTIMRNRIPIAHERSDDGECFVASTPAVVINKGDKITLKIEQDGIYEDCEFNQVADSPKTVFDLKLKKVGEQQLKIQFDTCTKDYLIQYRNLINDLQEITSGSTKDCSTTIKAPLKIGSTYILQYRSPGQNWNQLYFDYNLELTVTISDLTWLWILLGVLLGVAVIAGILVFWYLRKKRNQQKGTAEQQKLVVE